MPTLVTWTLMVTNWRFATFTIFSATLRLVDGTQTPPVQTLGARQSVSAVQVVLQAFVPQM